MNGMGSMSGTNGVGANNSNPSENEPLDPVFRGMPKPGQPLTSTPRVNPTPTQTSPSPAFANTSPSPVATPPSNLPTGSTSQTPFSAHSPSALDRLMNPSLAQNSSVPPVSFASSTTIPPTHTPVSSSPISPAPTTPTPASASTFKPYTPPTNPTSTFTPKSTFVPPAPTATPAPVVASMSTPTSQPAVAVASTSGYKVGAPSEYPAAPSANATAAKLGNEVHALLNNTQPTPKKHKGTLGLIIGMIVVLLLLAGGGYYWYTYMYLPNKDNTTESAQSDLSDSSNQSNTTGTQSAFPTAVTKPTVNTSAGTPATTPKPTTVAKPTTTKPATPPKVTRVTTPFTQAQRALVSSYIIANIGSIAPRANGPYEVTDVTFDGPDRAVVQYTNGNNSYTAVAVASIDTANNVRIVSFSPLEK